MTIERSWPAIVIVIIFTAALAYYAYNNLDHPNYRMSIPSWIALCAFVPISVAGIARVITAKEPALKISPEGIYDGLQRGWINWSEIKSIQRHRGFLEKHTGVYLYLIPVKKNYVSPVRSHHITTLVLSTSSERLHEILTAYFKVYGQATNPE